MPTAKHRALHVDPVTLEIVRGALRAIQSEMEAVIERTAMSPFIREKKEAHAQSHPEFLSDQRASIVQPAALGQGDQRRVFPINVRKQQRP